MIGVDMMEVLVPVKMDLVNNPVVVNVDPWNLVGIADRSTIRYELDLLVWDGESYVLEATLETFEEPVRTTGGTSSYRGAFFEFGDILKGIIKPYDDASFMDVDFLASISELPDMTAKYYTIVRVYVNNVLVNTRTNTQRWAYYGAISEIDFERYGADFFPG
jgi:hypothetical protein